MRTPDFRSLSRNGCRGDHPKWSLKRTLVRGPFELGRWASERQGRVISFIIPAYNEELVLGRTLGALNQAARASGQPFEVVLVDDASTDRTADVARQHGARVVSVNHRQIAATRNAGVKESVGEMLI